MTLNSTTFTLRYNHATSGLLSLTKTITNILLTETKKIILDEMEIRHKFSICTHTHTN